MPADVRNPGVRSITSPFVSHAAGAGAACRRVFGVQIAPASDFGAARFGFGPASFAIYTRIRYMSQQIDVDERPSLKDCIDLVG